MLLFRGDNMKAFDTLLLVSVMTKATGVESSKESSLLMGGGSIDCKQSYVSEMERQEV